MRNLIIFMVLAGIFMFGRRNSGCTWNGVKADGPTRTETRDLSNFHSIDVDLGADVTVLPSEIYKIEVTTADNLMNILKTNVENGVLRIFYEKNVWSDGDTKIKVYVPNLDHIMINSSADLIVQMPIHGESLMLSVNGSGSITAKEADFQKIESDISGSGTITLGGKATDLKGSVSGSGDILAEFLTTQNADIDISGSGSAVCDAVKTLKADISGSGHVNYKGSPVTNVSISGSGNVSQLKTVQ